jgi:hypothetical protein
VPQAIDRERRPVHRGQVRGDLSRIVSGSGAVGPRDEDVLRPTARRQQALTLGMAEQHDRLGILDLARLDHREGLRERQLEDLDVLVLVSHPAPIADAHVLRVLRDEEVQDLGHGAR